MTSRLWNAACLGACVGLLAACSVVDLGSARVATSPQAAFERGLYKGYLELAESEFGEGDHPDTSTFAKRAERVSSGQRVDPEELSARGILSGAVGDLTSARFRLMAALDATARKKSPDQAAHAQVMFDCWMQEQEENFQPDDIARCRSAFEIAMARVEDALRPPPVAEPKPEPEPVVEAEPVVEEPMPGPFLVFFDFDKADLTPDNQAILGAAARAARDRGAARVVVIGHADRSGPADYNMDLSNSRAAAVKEELQRLGVGSAFLGVYGRGESEPLVPTDDGVREPQNRRAEISLR